MQLPIGIFRPNTRYDYFVTESTRRLLRVEQRNSATPIERKPAWIKGKATPGSGFRQLQQRVDTGGVHTVCQAAGCPNIFECWEDREATFLIGGDICIKKSL